MGHRSNSMQKQLLLKIISIFFLGLFLVSCSETSPEPEPDFEGLKARAGQANDQLNIEMSEGPVLTIAGTRWITGLPPNWLGGTPSDSTFFYAVSHTKCTETNGKLCQAQAEAKGKAELAKNLSSEIETQSKLVVQRISSGGENSTSREYQQIIREKSKRELFEVGFVHYFDEKRRMVSSLVYIPQKDNFERSIADLVGSVVKTLPDNVIIGSFFKNGETRESYLSFYTGALIQENILALKGAAPEHIPNDPGESKSDYLAKMSSLEQPLLWGEFTGAGSKIKLRLRYKESGSGNSKLIQSSTLPFEGLVEKLSKVSRLDNTDTNSLTKSWNKVILATVSGRRPTPFYSNATVATFSLEIEERLVEKELKVVNAGDLKKLGQLKGEGLSLEVKKLTKNKPKTMVLVLSLGGDLNQHQGMLYKGLARADLTLSLFKPSGELVMKKTVSAKRFLVEDPKAMTDNKRNDECEKTVYKGMEEFGDDLISQVIEKML